MKVSLNYALPISLYHTLSLLQLLTSRSYTCICRQLPELRVRVKVTLRLAVSTNQFFLETSPFRPTTRIFIFQLNSCSYSPYVRVISFLMRGWVCRLQLLLVVARAVILRSESHGTHDHIFYCFWFQTPSTCRGRSPYLYPPASGWPGYTPRHCVPFSSPPATRRATVGVFDSASTQDALNFLYVSEDSWVWTWDLVHTGLQC
jgi:hypothetical protein